MSTTIPVDLTVTVHSPDKLTMVLELTCKRVEGGGVTLAFGNQEVTMREGCTLQLDYSLDRKEVSGLFGDKVLETIEQFIGEAKRERRSWFKR